MRAGRWPGLLALLAAVLLQLGSPAVAQAHAELQLASPAPGTGLAQAPASVVIKFSEPLNLELSRILVLDPTGRDVGTGSTAAVTGDPDAMQFAGFANRSRLDWLDWN